MIRIEALVQQFPGLDIAEVSAWVERDWVTPDRDATSDNGETWIFTDVDVARVRLIYDLRRDLDVAEDTIPVMLSLLDQVYDLRCALKAVNRAIQVQPSEIREAIREALAAQDLINRLDDRRT